jgi:hypothetical protein
MSFFRNRVGWTPLDAFPAFSIAKLKTIFFMVTIPFLTGRQLQEGNHTPDPHSHSFGSNEAIIQAKGSKAASIGDMALRPGRSPAHLLIPKILKRSGESGCHRDMS